MKAADPDSRNREAALAPHGMERLRFVSRRGVLRAGLLGTATVSLGGFLACEPDRAAGSSTRPQRVALSATGEEILRAICPVVLGGLLPAAGPARQSVLETGLASLDQYIAYLSSPLQREVRELFATLDLLPVRVLLTGRFARWSDTPPEAVESFLHSARSSRIFLLRRVYAFLQSLVVLGFFDQPIAWERVGYPGPLIARPDTQWGTR